MVSSFNHNVKIDIVWVGSFFAPASLNSGHLMTISSTAESVFFFVLLFFISVVSQNPLAIVNISEPYAQHTNKNNAILRLKPIVSFFSVVVLGRCCTESWPNLHLKHVQLQRRRVINCSNRSGSNSNNNGKFAIPFGSCCTSIESCKRRQ